MMEQLNRIELKGNVGNVRYSDTGSNHMARFSLATNYLYKTKDGEAAVETTWHSVVAWEGRNIKNLEKIEKGMPIHVIGRLRSSRYTAADGSEKQSYEVIASKLAILEETPDN